MKLYPDDREPFWEAWFSGDVGPIQAVTVGLFFITMLAAFLAILIRGFTGTLGQ